MESLADFEKRYKECQPIFEDIFILGSGQLKKWLKIIVKRHSDINDFHYDPAVVIKEIINDKPKEITVLFYDSIIINPAGIFYKKEHSCKELVTKLYDGVYCVNLELD